MIPSQQGFDPHDGSGAGCNLRLVMENKLSPCTCVVQVVNQRDTTLRIDMHLCVFKRFPREPNIAGVVFDQ
jgi:hypothetical protein